MGTAETVAAPGQTPRSEACGRSARDPQRYLLRPANGARVGLSAKTTEVRGPRGYDAGKKVTGRKRHVVVDTLGLLLFVLVHPANLQDRDGARLLFEKIRLRFPRLELIWADGGYAGPKLGDWVRQMCHWLLSIVKRSEDGSGF